MVVISGEDNRVIRNSGANSRPLSRAMGRCVGRGCRGPKGMFLKIIRQLSHPISKLIMFTGASGTLDHLGGVFHSNRIRGAC